MYLYQFFILRGHNIKDLLNLSATEKAFYKASMEIELEYQNKKRESIADALS